MSQTILVTGGHGFIGSHVARRLAERGNRVVVLDAAAPRAEIAWWLQPVADRLEFVQAAIDSWSEVLAVFQRYAPVAVVHTAAIGSPPALKERPFLALRVNLEGALHILEAARLFGARRVVLYSSIAVLPGIQQEPVTAAHPVILPAEGPGSGFYGASKVAVEAFCFGYRQAFDLDFIVLRPSAVYGFGMQHPIYIRPMVENALAGRPSRFASGREFPRDYTHVEDVTQLTLRALDIAPELVRDRVFFAATGQPLQTAGEVAEIVRRLIPTADIEIASGLSADDLVEIRYRGVLSIANAREQLGYEPKYEQLANGIAEYIVTYRRYLSQTSGQFGERP